MGNGEKGGGVGGAVFKLTFQCKGAELRKNGLFYYSPLLPLFLLPCLWREYCLGFGSQAPHSPTSAAPPVQSPPLQQALFSTWSQWTPPPPPFHLCYSLFKMGGGGGGGMIRVKQQATCASKNGAPVFKSLSGLVRKGLEGKREGEGCLLLNDYYKNCYRQRLLSWLPSDCLFLTFRSSMKPFRSQVHYHLLLTVFMQLTVTQTATVIFSTQFDTLTKMKGGWEFCLLVSATTRLCQFISQRHLASRKLWFKFILQKQ